MKGPSPARSGWRDGWYVVPHEVTWRDLDAIGHVNNAVYFSYFEWGRTRMWLDMHGQSDPFDIRFIVAHAECDFLLQLGLTEQIDVGVKIAGLRNTSFDFVYEIRKSRGRELAATGKVTVVLYNWETKSKMTISEELRRKIDLFQSDVK